MTPTVNTYAHLERPSVFRPSETARFMLYYSADLCPMYATLTFFGGEYGYGTPYHLVAKIESCPEGQEQTVLAQYVDGGWGQEVIIKDRNRGYGAVWAYIPTGDGSCSWQDIGVAETTGEDRTSKHYYKQTQLANSITAGQPSEEFIVPAYRIGDEPYNHDYISFSFSGKLQARVELGSELDSEGHVINPVFTSNTILVPFYLAPEYPLDFGMNETPPTTADSSVFKPWASYHYYSGFSATNDCELNSYRLLLYDNDENIIWDGGTKYDWSPNPQTYQQMKFTGLKDNTTYKYKIKGSLVGGYQVESPMYAVKVKYKANPVTSNVILLENKPYKGCVHISTNIPETHTRVIVKRCVKDTDEFVTLRTRNTKGDIQFNDYMCLPNKIYTYKLAVYNGDELVKEYNNEIEHTMVGICICDLYGAYATEVEVTKYPIAKNSRAIFQEPVGNKYPYAVITSNLNYFKSSSTKGTFLEGNNDCSITQDDINGGNEAYSISFLDWLNNGRTKLLKYDSGFAVIVAIEGEPQTEGESNATGKSLLGTTFGWREIADKDDIDNYTKLGLIGDI